MHPPTENPPWAAQRIRRHAETIPAAKPSHDAHAVALALEVLAARFDVLAATDRPPSWELSARVVRDFAARLNGADHG